MNTNDSRNYTFQKTRNEKRENLSNGIVDHFNFKVKLIHFDVNYHINISSIIQRIKVRMFCMVLYGFVHTFPTILSNPSLSVPTTLLTGRKLTDSISLTRKMEKEKEIWNWKTKIIDGKKLELFIWFVVKYLKDWLMVRTYDDLMCKQHTHCYH